MPALGRVAAALGVRCCPIWALLLWFSTSILRFPQYVFLFHETTTKFFHSFLTVFCIIYHVQCEATMELAACAHCGWPCNSSTIVKIRCVFDWHMGYNHPCTTYTLIIVDTISVILLKVIWYWLGLIFLPWRPVHNIYIFSTPLCLQACILCGIPVYFLADVSKVFFHFFRFIYSDTLQFLWLIMLMKFEKKN